MEKLRQNCVSISGSFRKVALLWNLEFGIEWVRGRTSSLALSGPGPDLGRSCPGGPSSRPVGAEDWFWKELPSFSPRSTTWTGP